MLLPGPLFLASTELSQQQGEIMQCQDFSSKTITQQGRGRLDAQIAEWRQSLADMRGKSSDRDARGAGNTGSGSKMQDEATRQHNIVRGHIDRLTRLRNHAQIAPVPKSRKTLRIGTIGVFLYQTKVGGKSCDVRKTYEIVGFEEGDCDSVPRKISYETPLAIAFLGAEVGTQELVHQDGKIRTVTMTAIRLPKQAAKAEEILTASVA